MSIRVLSPGPLTTVQDEGRFGYLQAGVTTSGAMDQDAYRAANLLAGNPSGCAVLECTLFGPTLCFQEAAVIALTGADMNAMIDQQPVPRYRRLQLQAGQTLSMSFAGQGCRAYIAVPGGIDVPMVMGSRSTNLLCHIGGMDGRRLQAGDLLPVGTCRHQFGKTMSLPIPVYSEHPTIRVVPGPQARRFSSEAIDCFYSQAYTVTQDSDRMGIRLDGIPLSHDGVDILSDGIAFGSIQITAEGKPIVLMADHQTTGGYAKIATVCSFDLPLLAQCKPGDQVRFRAVSVQEAQRVLRAGQSILMRWRHAMRRPK